MDAFSGLFCNNGYKIISTKNTETWNSYFCQQIQILITKKWMKSLFLTKESDRSL